MAGKVTKSRRRSQAPAAAEADAEAQHSAKKAKRPPARAAAGPETREERFLVKLAEALSVRSTDESAALRTISAVKEALRVALAALPEGKALKTRLQAGLEEYSVLLAKLLGISEPSSSAPTPTSKAKPPAITGKCALVLDSVYEQQLSHLKSCDPTALLLARAPPPLEVVRLALGQKASDPLEALRAGLRLWPCLTPVGPDGPGVYSLWLAGAAELAEEALRASVSGKAEAKEVRKLLAQFFAGQAIRKRRHAVDLEKPAHGSLSVFSGSGSRPGGGRSAGRLVLLQAQTVALDSGITAASTDSPWPGRSEVSASVAFGLSAIGSWAWEELADELLSPDYSLIISEGQADAHRIDTSVWQAVYAGMETEQARQASLQGCLSLQGGSRVRGSPGAYLRWVLLGKRAVGRQRAARTSSSSLGPGQAVLTAAVPKELSSWLETQPLNKTVSTCLTVLRKRTEGLTPHLVLSATERDVADLLAAWEKSAAPGADGETEEDTSNRLLDTLAAGTNDSLFFVDTTGQGFNGTQGGDDDDSSLDGDDPDDQGRDGGVEALMQGADGGSDSDDDGASQDSEEENDGSSDDDAT